jgi:hypothetical protein
MKNQKLNKKIEMNMKRGEQSGNSRKMRQSIRRGELGAF